MEPVIESKLTIKPHHGIGYRAKVLLAIGGITLLACALVSFCFFRMASQTIEENYVHSQSRMMHVTINSLENMLSSAYDTSIALSCDTELYQMMKDYVQETSGQGDAQGISTYLRKYQTNGSLIDSIYVYLPEREQIITSIDYHALQEVFFHESFSWLRYQKEHSAGTQLAPVVLYDDVSRAPSYVLTYTRPIYDDNHHLLAWIAVNLSEHDLYYQLISEGAQSAEDESYLVNPDGMIMLSQNNMYLSQNFADVRPGCTLPTGAETSERYGKNQLMIALHSPLTGFQLISLSNRSRITSDLKKQLGYILGVLAFTTVVMLMVAFYVSRWMYEPVKNLKDAMKQVQEGDLSARAKVWEHDEIGELSEGFNQTVEQIEWLIRQLVDEQMQKKEAELEALQYQITPHFMYNTLNSIKYAALLQGADRIGEQLGAFIELLQASISRQGAFLTVGEEIHLVENYVKLQKFRYMDTFDVTFNVESDVHDLYVPRLILQPLVENAILHGTQQGKPGCKIQVDARLEGMELLVLRVTDNGAGMTPEEVIRLMTGKRVGRKSGFSGIGIPNIKERLRLYYGDRGQLEYYSTPGVGTQAVITMPASHDAAEYQI